MSINTNLHSALNVCKALSVDDLLSLAIGIGESKSGIQNWDEWITAIATFLDRKATKQNHSFNLN